MSLTLSLVPLAIAIGMSLGSVSIASMTSLRGKSETLLAPVETTFCDSALLKKTLGEHGLQVQLLSENEYVIETESGVLRYFRDSESTPFYLEVKDVVNMEELLGSLDELEHEYGRNVQSFTYDKVMHSLAEHGMRVEQEEILEDDSILLTLQV